MKRETMGLNSKEIRALSLEEQSAKLAELKKNLSKEKGLVASGTRPENPGKIRDSRKTVARILTIQRETELKIGKEKGAKNKNG